VTKDLVLIAGYSLADILDMTVVGNTVMHHIFLNILPDNLGRPPFRPSVEASMDVKARDLGIEINPAAHIYVLPVEAGYVGADNVAVLISETPYEKDELTLIIDIGTNGEIVLGNREKLFSCSCATGPALEGAGLSCGMRAVKGAIEKLRIDPTPLIGLLFGRSEWLGKRGSAMECETIRFMRFGYYRYPGAAFTLARVINENGMFRQEVRAPRLRTDKKGTKEFVIVWRDETATGKEIVITQHDIRQIQLAKAALRAGCEVLMRHYGKNQ